MSEIDEPLAELPSELAHSSDRVCGVVAGAILESLLEELLRKSLIAERSGRLLSGYGPLSSLAAKVDVLHALGSLSESEAQDLHRIRRIRNEFAHSFEEKSFSSSPICDHVSQLNFRTSVLLQKKRTARVDFLNCVAILSGFLKSKILNAQAPEADPDILDGMMSHLAAAARKPDDTPSE